MRNNKTTFISSIRNILSKSIKNVGEREKSNTQLSFRNLSFHGDVINSRKDTLEHQVKAEAERASGYENVSLSLELDTSSITCSDSTVRNKRKA